MNKFINKLMTAMLTFSLIFSYTFTNVSASTELESEIAINSDIIEVYGSTVEVISKGSTINANISEFIVDGEYVKIVETPLKVTFYDAANNIILEFANFYFNSKPESNNMIMPRFGFAWTNYYDASYSIAEVVGEGVGLVTAYITSKLDWLTGFILGVSVVEIAENIVNAIYDGNNWEVMVYVNRSEGYYGGCEILEGRKESYYTGKNSSGFVGHIRSDEAYFWYSTPWDYTQPSKCRELESSEYPY